MSIFGSVLCPGSVVHRLGDLSLGISTSQISKRQGPHIPIRILTFFSQAIFLL